MRVKVLLLQFEKRESELKLKIMSYKRRYKKKEVKNSIGGFFHCKKCIEQFPGSTPYRQDIEVGWTKKVVQVWCRRHDINLVHIDFRGQKVSKVV